MRMTSQIKDVIEQLTEKEDEEIKIIELKLIIYLTPLNLPKGRKFPPLGELKGVNCIMCVIIQFYKIISFFLPSPEPASIIQYCQPL